ncbi:MAG TPA: CPBP family intramembrane glutamic endopeptidase [Tepidisphaeraceae bacterium]|jgi:membrane protease YdiL (CAAX protease family)
MRVTVVLSWAVILTLAIGLPVLHAVNASMEKAAAARVVTTTRAVELPGTGSDVLPDAGDSAEAPPVSLELRFASKYAVGTQRLFGVTDPTLIEQLDKQARSDTDRVAIAVMAGEIKGRDAALGRLAAIDSADARAFERAYASTQPAADQPLHGGSFDAADHAGRYGFFADLAAANGKPAEQRQAVDARAKEAVYRAMILLGLGLGALVAGVLLCVAGIVLASTGNLRFRTTAPILPTAYYVEAFALYLVLLLGGSALTTLLPAAWPILFKLLPLSAVVVFAAAWPLLRARLAGARPDRGTGFQPVFASDVGNANLAAGAADHSSGARATAEAMSLPLPPPPGISTQRSTTWQAFQQDVGLHTGAGVLKEIAFGVLGYLAGLPIVGLALLVVLFLSRWAEQTTSHPIVQTMDQTSVWSLLLLAAVFAPITEELMFRGLFVSHLRRGMGVALAAVLSGLVFAAVHPQGWLAIPALMTIGGWFAVVRQWRGSLIASTVMHAINNGVIVVVMVGLLK